MKPMNRRHFLQGSASLLSAAGLGSVMAAEPAGVAPARVPGAVADGGTQTLAPILASADRIIEMNVCTRPFRPQGPRIEPERMGRKTVVHNYGHGGSGWSLSWGSGALAVAMAQDSARGNLAVVGCGAIGLTTALQAQRAGLEVTIYARERPPLVRSAWATGAWTPDSRICTAEFAPQFAERWETMARYSFRRFQALLGLPGYPIEWQPMYTLSDTPFDAESAHQESREPEYPDFTRELIPDLTPRSVDLSVHPFGAAHVRRRPLMLFNISAYTDHLLREFLLLGGKLVTLELTDRSDFNALDERTIVNCTGWGARALLEDDSLVPVRGQTCKLIPQPEVNYGITYGDREVAVYPRRDGLLVQAQADTDYGNDTETLDPAESIAAVERLAGIVNEMQVGDA